MFVGHYAVAVLEQYRRPSSPEPEDCAYRQLGDLFIFSNVGILGEPTSPPVPSVTHNRQWLLPKREIPTEGE